MPSQICSLCIHNLTKYYLFKNSCTENESFLKSCLEKYISETKEFIKPDITNEYDVSDLDSDIHDDLPLILRIDNPIKKKRRKKQGNENNVYTCKQCNKTFQFRYKLVMHLRVHTKEKPFKCDECNLGFSLSGNLKRHKMIHSGDRPHICKICGKGKNNCIRFQKNCIKIFQVLSKAHRCKCTFKSITLPTINRISLARYAAGFS